MEKGLKNKKRHHYVEFNFREQKNIFIFRTSNSIV